MIDHTEDIHSEEVAKHLDAVASIRRGLAQAKKGEGRSVDAVFDDIEREPVP